MEWRFIKARVFKKHCEQLLFHFQRLCVFCTKQKCSSAAFWREKPCKWKKVLNTWCLEKCLRHTIYKSIWRNKHIRLPSFQGNTVMMRGRISHTSCAVKRLKSKLWPWTSLVVGILIWSLIWPHWIVCSFETEGRLKQTNKKPNEQKKSHQWF